MFDLAQTFHNEDSSHIYGEFKLQAMKIQFKHMQGSTEIFEWDRAKNTPASTAVSANCGTAPCIKVDMLFALCDTVTRDSKL
jgi:hypothetical protein